MVQRLADQLHAAGFDPPVVNLHYKGESVRDALAGRAIRFSEESAVMGTAGGIGWAIQQGLLRTDAPLLVVNGKIHTDVNFRTIMSHHPPGVGVTMVLTPNLEREAFREVYVEDGRVTGFGAGRTPESEAPLAFTGIQVFGPTALSRIEPRPSDTVQDVVMPLLASGDVRAMVTHRRWWECSTPERYLGLHLRAWSEGIAAGPANESVVWENSVIDPAARVKRCIVLDEVHLPAGGLFESEVVFRDENGRMRRQALDPEHVARSAHFAKPVPSSGTHGFAGASSDPFDDA